MTLPLKTEAPRRVGVFTKMDKVGGSELRVVELANAISAVEGYRSVLLVERDMPERLRLLVRPQVELHAGVFSRPNVEALYGLDCLLVINSNSRRFTSLEYWSGATPSHPHGVDLGRIKTLTFLFNYVVSPASQLSSISSLVPDVRIITANKKFFNEMGSQNRYEPVRHFPRMRLESPINPDVALPKTASPRLRLGMHSLPNRRKWNRQWPELIPRLNAEFGDRIAWDFMGMPRSLQEKIRAENVVLRREFLTPVSEYLRGIDIFVFFVEWRHDEAWASSVGEALMSGCPVVTTARGGNRDQVVEGNNGFLCGHLDEFVLACRKLLLNPALLRALQENARRASKEYASENVTRRLLSFLE